VHALRHDKVGQDGTVGDVSNSLPHMLADLRDAKSRE
jgi:hypothetical protein